MCGVSQGRVCNGGAREDTYRVVSDDTMKLLLLIRHGVGDHELVPAWRPNKIALRIGAAARRAGWERGTPGTTNPCGLLPSYGIGLTLSGQ